MDRRTFLWLAPVAALALTACSRSDSSAGASSTEIKPLTVEEVAARIASHDGKTFVYDDNPKERYLQGHVPGARWVASGDVTADVLPADKGATLVFYCANEA